MTNSFLGLMVQTSGGRGGEREHSARKRQVAKKGGWHRRVSGREGLWLSPSLSVYHFSAIAAEFLLHCIPESEPCGIS